MKNLDSNDMYLKVSKLMLTSNPMFPFVSGCATVLAMRSLLQVSKKFDLCDDCIDKIAKKLESESVKKPKNLFKLLKKRGVKMSMKSEGEWFAKWFNENWIFHGGIVSKDDAIHLLGFSHERFMMWLSMNRIPYIEYEGHKYFSYSCILKLRSEVSK